MAQLRRRAMPYFLAHRHDVIFLRHIFRGIPAASAFPETAWTSLGYVPGSHKLRDNPRPDGEYPTVPIIGKEGSVAFLHGYTWHKTGANISRDQMRRALFAYYVRPFLRVHVLTLKGTTNPRLE